LECEVAACVWCQVCTKAIGCWISLAQQPDCCVLPTLLLHHHCTRTCCSHGAAAGGTGRRPQSVEHERAAPLGAHRWAPGDCAHPHPPGAWFCSCTSCTEVACGRQSYQIGSAQAGRPLFPVLFDIAHCDPILPPLQGANPQFTDSFGQTALDAAAGGDAEARRALKREAAARRVCACCGATPADGVRLKRCARCRLVQCELGYVWDGLPVD